jgi:hypothetical protein
MSALWDYMSKQHGLNLLGSEIEDILALARQEIELPDEDEINEMVKEISITSKGYDIPPEIEELHLELVQKGFIIGATKALCKVRNPYPKAMQFHRDDEEGITG